MRLSDSLFEVTKIGVRELSKSVSTARHKLHKMQLIYQRKELFAELGRALYEYSMSEEVSVHEREILAQIDVQETIADLKKLDMLLEKLRN